MSNYFENPHQKLGLIESGVKKKIVFKAKKSLEIESIKTSCGCTSAQYKKFGKKIVVKYTPDKIPIQVNKEFVSTTKMITVSLKSGRVEMLSFTANVIK